MKDDIWKQFYKDNYRRQGMHINRAIVVMLVGCIVCVWMPLVFMIVS